MQIRVGSAGWGIARTVPHVLAAALFGVPRGHGIAVVGAPAATPSRRQENKGVARRRLPVLGLQTDFRPALTALRGYIPPPPWRFYTARARNGYKEPTERERVRRSSAFPSRGEARMRIRASAIYRRLIWPAAALAGRSADKRESASPIGPESRRAQDKLPEMPARR